MSSKEIIIEGSIVSMHADILCAFQNAEREWGNIKLSAEVIVKTPDPSDTDIKLAHIYFWANLLRLRLVNPVQSSVNLIDPPVKISGVHTLQHDFAKMTKIEYDLIRALSNLESARLAESMAIEAADLSGVLAFQTLIQTNEAIVLDRLEDCRLPLPDRERLQVRITLKPDNPSI